MPGGSRGHRRGRRSPNLRFSSQLRIGPRRRARLDGLPDNNMLLALPIIAGLGSTAALAAYHATYGVRSQWLGRTDWRGRTDTNEVALTFDDGPAPETEQILDTLNRYGVKATFFMIGRQVERYPRIARRVADSGHKIGNHSYSHPIFLYRSALETRRQLARTQ